MPAKKEETIDELIARARRGRGATVKPKTKPKGSTTKPKKPKKSMFQKLLEGDLSR
jgi:hypothetical protein